MDIEFYEKDIKRIFNENDCYYDWDINPDGTIEVNVEWGDWKHDHLFLNYIMRENHYRLIDEDVTEEDGDDAYSSIHTFEYVA